MTAPQTPTPGVPLSAESVKLLKAGDWLETISAIFAPVGTLMMVTSVDDKGVNVLDRGGENSFYFKTLVGDFRLTTPAVPVEGRYVPVEPTETMIEAAANAPFSDARKATTNVHDRLLQTVADMLRAGIAAAPALTSAPAPVGGGEVWDSQRIDKLFEPLRSEDDERYGNVVNGTLDEARDAILAALTTPKEAPAATGAGEREMLRVLLDNLVIAQSLSKDLRTRATEEARSYLYDLRAQPQAREEAKPVHCHHEAYQGCCAHCGVKIVNGFAVTPTTPPAPEAEKLRIAVEALKPFAILSEIISTKDGEPIIPDDDDAFPAGPIRWKHLRAAWSALRQIGEGK